MRRTGRRRGVDLGKHLDVELAARPQAIKGKTVPDESDDGDSLTYDEVIARNLKVMDTAAFALARDNGLPILVYALDDKEGLMGVLSGKTRSTFVGIDKK